MLHSQRISRTALMLACFGMTVPAWAQTDAPDTTGTGSAYFQNATIVGTTNSISITDVPVTANGRTYYWNLTLPFDVDSEGNVMTGLLQAKKSTIFIDSALMAGTYVGPSTIYDGEMKIALAGPSLWNGTYTQWTISSTSGAYICTYPNTGSFHVVPALADYPNSFYARLKTAGITDTSSYYGTGSSTAGCVPYYNWPPDGIIGVSQVGNTLKIVSFSTYDSSTGKPVDHNSQVDEITYTLVP